MYYIFVCLLIILFVIFYEYDVVCCRKIIELEEELKIVSNNMKSLEIAEQEVFLLYFAFKLLQQSIPSRNTITHTSALRAV